MFILFNYYWCSSYNVVGTTALGESVLETVLAQVQMLQSHHISWFINFSGTLAITATSVLSLTGVSATG
jgi:hypothetical protein